jgi:hypothetical protein
MGETAAADPQAAAVASARRRVRRAAGLLREATRDLALASDSTDTVAVVHVYDDDEAQVDDAVEAVRHAAGQYPAGIAVVVLAHQGRPPAA